MAGAAFQLVRGQVFERSPVLQVVLARRGWDFTPDDLVLAAQEVSAWHALRARLERERLLEALERGAPWALLRDAEVDLLRRIAEFDRLKPEVKDLRSAVEYLAKLVRRMSELRPSMPVARAWRPDREPREAMLPAGVLVDELEARVPEALMAQLVAVLGRLVSEFMGELDKLGKRDVPEVPPARQPVEVRVAGRAGPAAGVPGQVRRGFGVSEFGDSVCLTALVPMGGMASIVSGTLWGPAVVERMWYAAGGGVEGGRIAARVWGGRGSVDPAFGFGDVYGDSLFEGASNSAAGGAVVEADAFVGRAEWWPRRLVPYGSWSVVFQAQNTGGADRWMALGLDVRDVVWKG